MSEQLNILNQSACRHLLSKGMFVTGMMNPAEEDGQVGDGYCWCNQTQNVLGPDDGLVSRQACHAGRTCYQGLI
jgi:hypothetical protein